MNIILWILQFLLGIYFFVMGIVHFIVPSSLPTPMGWVYDVPPALHYFSGTAEILAGLGLVLPGLTRIQTRLTPVAALGLVAVMVGAAVWHFARNEYWNIVVNLILAGFAGFTAYGRWRLSPLKAKDSS